MDERDDYDDSDGSPPWWVGRVSGWRIAGLVALILACSAAVAVAIQAFSKLAH